MALASKPEDQSRRLAELDRYAVLDTAPEQSFDDVVALVARLLDMPVALISLVDEDRQWFKARVGMDATQTDLQRSICSHAILVDGLTEISDTANDPRTLDNPLCCGIDGRMRFYAGAPLVTPSGRKLGTLCVLDDKPRNLTDLQRQVLRVMADQIMHQLDLRAALAAEEVMRDEIDHRVKNSLQTVTSFLRLYRSRAKQDETREMLDAVTRRINAVSELHGALYQSEVFGEVPLRTYILRLADLLGQQAPEGVRITAACAERSVSSQTASALALILSEFVANSYKHGFSGRGGSISVSLDCVDHCLVLTCRDDGIGAGAEQGTGTGIGMRLIEASAEQLGGVLETGPLPQGGFGLVLSIPMTAPLSPAEAVSSAG